MVVVGVVAKGRHVAAGRVSVNAQGCGCGGTFDGHLTGGRLQGRADGQGVDLERSVEGF